MIDREKVIKGLEEAETRLTQAVDRGGQMSVMGAFKCLNRVTDAIALLKEQEEREERICKAICDIIRGGCSTDTDADKDFVCHEIRKCFMEGGKVE